MYIGSKVYRKKPGCHVHASSQTVVTRKRDFKMTNHQRYFTGSKVQEPN